MGVKPMIFVLLIVQNCLSYPIDEQDTRNDADSSQQFSKNFFSDNPNVQIMENFKPESIPISSNREPRQYISGMEPSSMQFDLDYPNIAESNRPTHFGGHRPIGRPPRPLRPHPQPPMDFPDDVEVFSPSGPISPPRPIPVGPISPPDVETFWPINGKPVPFPKDEVLGTGGGLEPLPHQQIVLEREFFPVIPKHIEGDIHMVPELMRNERPVIMERDGLPMTPVLVEKPSSVILEQEQSPNIMPVYPENGVPRMTPIKQDSVILDREQPPQMMQVFGENDPPRMTPIKQDSVILDREQPSQMMPVFVENGPAGMPSTIMEKIERPVIIEQERPRMTPFREREPAQMIMEPPFMSPAEQSQMRFLSQNERNMKNPTEFRPIPQMLPERFKRDNQMFNDDSKTTNLPQEGESDQVKGKSVVDNEISNDDFIQNNLFYTEDNYDDRSSTEKLPISDSNSSVQDETSSSVINNHSSTEKLPTSNENGVNSEISVEGKTGETPSQSVSTQSIEEISTTISTYDEKKILDEVDPSSAGRILINEDSKYEQPSNLDISTTVEPLIKNNAKYTKLTSTSTSDTKNVAVNRDLTTAQSPNLEIKTVDQAPIKNNEKIISSPIMAISDVKNEDLNRNLPPKQSSYSSVSITTQPPNDKSNEKMVASTSMSTSDAEVKDVKENLAPQPSLNSDISVNNENMDTKKLSPSPTITTTNIEDEEIKPVITINSNLATSEGIQSTKPAEISTPDSLNSAEKIHSALKDVLLTELRRLLEAIENNDKRQNVTLDQHPIGLQNANHPSISFNPAGKIPHVYYGTPIEGFPSTFYIQRGNNTGGPIPFPNPVHYQADLPDIHYNLNEEIGQLLGGVLDVEHELQSLPVSHGVHRSPIVYPSYNLHYPIPPLSPLSVILRRASQDHSYHYNY